MCNAILRVGIASPSFGERALDGPSARDPAGIVGEHRCQKPMAATRPCFAGKVASAFSGQPVTQKLAMQFTRRMSAATCSRDQSLDTGRSLTTSPVRSPLRWKIEGAFKAHAMRHSLAKRLRKQVSVDEVEFKHRVAKAIKKCHPFRIVRHFCHRLARIVHVGNPRSACHRRHASVGSSRAGVNASSIDIELQL